jgi:putative ABC transport system permease protein
VPAHVVAPRELFGRLRPGVSLEQADAELASRTQPAHPSGSPRVLGVHRGLGIDVGTMRTAGRVYTQILLMLVVGTAISLIAAGSFSLLLFARLLSSQADFSIRLALGARARDLIRLLAIEVGLLAAVATGVALGVGVLVTRLFFAQLAGAGGPAFIPDLTIDWRLAGYTVATTFGAAAMVVARLAWNLRSFEALGSMVVTSGVGGATQRTAGETSRLVIAQTAVATMLLLVAAMLVRTVIAAETPDVGVDPDRSVVTWMDITALPDDAEQAAAAIRRAVDVTQQVPGVAEATAITLLPGTNTGWFNVSTGSSGPGFSARTHYVTASAITTLQRPIRRGRTFTADEDRSGARVAVVSTTAATRLWPDLDPLGRRLWVRQDDGTREAFVVVGIAGDAPLSDAERRGGRREARDVYFPLLHRREWRPVGILARSHDDDGGRLAERLRDAYRLQLPDTGLLSVRSVREELDSRLESAAFSARAYSTIGGLVFIVALGGLYGLSAHLASLRRREMGIRRALGATPVMLCRMLHAEHRRMLGLGVGIGALGGIFLASLILPWFPTLDLWDPWSLIVVASTLYAAGLAGALLPFIRTMRSAAIALRLP